MSVQLTAPERASLTELESLIARGLDTFREVGAALREIRDDRLYRESHGTFEDYCRERWDLTILAVRLLDGMPS